MQYITWSRIVISQVVLSIKFVVELLAKEEFHAIVCQVTSTVCVTGHAQGQCNLQITYTKIAFFMVYMSCVNLIVLYMVVAASIVTH